MQTIADFATPKQLRANGRAVAQLRCRWTKLISPLLVTLCPRHFEARRSPVAYNPSSCQLSNQCQCGRSCSRPCPRVSMLPSTINGTQMSVPCYILPTRLLKHNKTFRSNLGWGGGSIIARTNQGCPAAHLGCECSSVCHLHMEKLVGTWWDKNGQKAAPEGTAVFNPDSRSPLPPSTVSASTKAKPDEQGYP